VLSFGLVGCCWTKLHINTFLLICTYFVSDVARALNKSRNTERDDENKRTNVFWVKICPNALDGKFFIQISMLT
jgi:hypothetical protein